jgi:hypothetical protein
MKAILKFISNNKLVSTLVAAAILGAIGGIWKWWLDRRDSDAVYRFMLDSKSRTDFDFRSTPAIASHTRLSTQRVAYLCARHPKVRRNENERESWTLLD